MSWSSRLLRGLGGPVPKEYQDGTHRLIPPEDTLARVRPFLSEMGITRIANVTGLDCIGIPVVMVCRPNSRSLAVSQGKGLHLSAAKASGVMESIELYHAERVTLPLKLASYTELRRGHRVVEVAELAGVAGSRFHPDLPLLWIEGEDLLQGEPVWLPFETVHISDARPQPTGSGCFAASSNGLASGNHLLEAISHGICEVVERDSTTLWHLLEEEAQQATRIDTSTVDDPGCRDAIGRCARAGLEVVLWDMTTDVGIPTFHCLLIERTADPARLLYSAAGMGSHPARQVALLRAITEAAQSRLTLIAGSRDDVFRDEYEESQRSVAYLRRQRNLLRSQAPTRSFRDTPTWAGETFDDDVARELERLRAAGVTRVIAVDLTKPEFGLPVVRIVIPGLEGPDKMPGYVPGARARALARGDT